MIKKFKINNFLIAATVAILLIGAIIPSIQATSLNEYKGFDKGPSYNPVVPIKKVTFVDFDEESLLDDYSYLAAIPTAVFNEDEKLVSHPLMFFQEELDYDELDYDEEKYKTLDAYEGIEYFMEDWMSYSNGALDQMTLINVDKERLDDDWDSDECIVIDGKDPYSIANKLALTARAVTKEEPIIKTGIGKEDMKDEEIADNAFTIFNAILHAVPNEIHNVKSMFIKLSMGPIVEITNKGPVFKEEPKKPKEEVKK